MNVLIAVPWFSPGTVGGVGLNVYLAAQELVRRGHRVRVLIHGDNHQVQHVADDGEVPIYSIYLRRPSIQSHRFKSMVAFGLYFFTILRELRRFIRREKIDVIIIYYPGLADIYYRLMKLIWGTRYIVSPQGSDINIEAQADWMATAAVRSVINHADGLIANSVHMLEATRDFCRGHLPARAEVIHLGIDTRWADNPSASAYETDRDYILTLAWAIPVKGPDIVMRAFASIAGEYPGVDLVMVGGGPQVQEMDKLRDELGMADRIIRLGTVKHDSLPPLFEKALFGVVPSRNEAFGIVNLEFGWMNKAVVATRVGGIPEVIKDGVTGLLVDSEDVQGMAEKMKYLLDHPEECHRMGAAARRRIEDKFTDKRAGDQIEEFLKSTIEC